MRAILLIIVSITMLPTTSCTGKKKENVFVYCSEGSPSSFNPQIATDGASYNVTSHIYNKLVDFEHGKTNLIPSLAESWEVSPDGLKFTFKLRKNVKWHITDYFKPTRDFNADDVLFSFNRQRLKTHPFHSVSSGTYDYFNSMEMGVIIKDIKKVDDFTVEFELSKPEAPFLANLAMDYASILSKEYADQLIKSKKLENIDREPVGTGPYSFVRYDKDSMIRMRSHKNYFEGEPSIKRLVFAITKDPSVRFQKLKAGECQLVAHPAPADIKNMKGAKDLKVVEEAGVNVGYIAMNVQRKPFDNQKVRLAINYAINKPALIDAIYLGTAMVAKNPLPPSMWGYNDEVEDYSFNIDKAKSLLKEAGFEDGFETEMWTLPVSRPYNPNGKKMGEMIQADLAKVGIKVKLISYDWPTYLKKSRSGEHQMIQLGWTGDNGDPDNFLNVLLGCPAVEGGSNVARWCNKEFNDYIQKAKATTDQKERSKLYKEAQVIFKKEVPWVTVAHAKVFRAMRSNVSGYVIDPFGKDYFYPVKVLR